MSKMYSPLLRNIQNSGRKDTQKSEGVNQSCMTLCDPWAKPASLLCPWNSPGKNTGVGSSPLSKGSS